MPHMLASRISGDILVKPRRCTHVRYETQKVANVVGAMLRRCVFFSSIGLTMTGKSGGSNGSLLSSEDIFSGQVWESADSVARSGWLLAHSPSLTTAATAAARVGPPTVSSWN